MRAIVIVLDGCGAGEAKDAGAYGDARSNTLANTAKAVGGLSVPNLQNFGLGNIVAIAGVPPANPPLASFGSMEPASPGKDSVTGHWEMMGIVRSEAPRIHPDGFPAEFVARLSQLTATEYLWNRPASGTEIIARLGKEHLTTRKPILYTSGDSVLQIAAHEVVIAVPSLYALCEIARMLAGNEQLVDRVIARPFAGPPGNFHRLNEKRRDFVVTPPGDCVLDSMKAAGFKTIGVGVVTRLFPCRCFTDLEEAHTNQESFDATMRWMKADFDGLLFANLEDFDMIYGHRNDPQGFAEALARFDAQLPALLGLVRPGDLFVITADHGNDPTTPST
ncbi:MAG: phosphopentomutase, partial [bacterium]